METKLTLQQLTYIVDNKILFHVDQKKFRIERDDFGYSVQYRFYSGIDILGLFRITQRPDGIVEYVGNGQAESNILAGNNLDNLRQMWDRIYDKLIWPMIEHEELEILGLGDLKGIIVSVSLQDVREHLAALCGSNSTFGIYLAGEIVTSDRLTIIDVARAKILETEKGAVVGTVYLFPQAESTRVEFERKDTLWNLPIDENLVFLDFAMKAKAYFRRRNLIQSIAIDQTDRKVDSSNTYHILRGKVRATAQDLETWIRDCLTSHYFIIERHDLDETKKRFNLCFKQRRFLNPPEPIDVPWGGAKIIEWSDGTSEIVDMWADEPDDWEVSRTKTEDDREIWNQRLNWLQELSDEIREKYQVEEKRSAQTVQIDSRQIDESSEEIATNYDEAIRRFGTDKDLSLSDVKAIVKKCNAFIQRGGKVAEFCRQYSENKYTLETLRKWLRDARFAD